MAANYLSWNRHSDYDTVPRSLQPVLRPLEPIPLEDRQEVTVTISDEGDFPRDHPLLASSDEWDAAASDDISPR